MKVKLRLLAAVVICALVFVPATVLAPVFLPFSVDGHITINSVPATAGTVVTAKIDGVSVGDPLAYTTIDGPVPFGPDYYFFKIPYDASYAGKMVVFYVNGVEAQSLPYVNEGYSPDFDLSISVVPDISVSPTSIDFGSVDMCTSSRAKRVTVSNDGGANLNVLTIVLTGTHANQFSIENDNCSGESIAPGASKTLEVVFSPTSTGGKSATLSIPSNDPDENPVLVPLSGTGVAVVGGISPATVTKTLRPGGCVTVTKTVTVPTGEVCGAKVLDLHLAVVEAHFELWVVFDPTSYYEVEGGESVTFSETICVPAGTDPGTYTFTVRALDEEEESYGDQTVKITVREKVEEVAGVLPPEAAKIGASYLYISPQQIVPSQWVEISANIYNRGGTKATHTVALYINGYLAQSQAVGVSPGGTELVVFRVRADSEFLGGIYTGPGEYIANVEGMVGQFFVLAPAVAAPAAFGGPLGTAGIIAIVVVVLVLIVGLVFGLKRE